MTSLHNKINARSSASCAIMEIYRHRKKGWRVWSKSTLLVMAGTRWAAKSISIAICHLPANPETMQRVRSELGTVSDSASWTEPEQLPYLSAVVAEADRLAFSVTPRVCCIAPNEDLRYQEHTILASTLMSMTTLPMHTDEIVFSDPWTCKPERWL